jgi:L,D-peptidoglycan transpeptidase YkuD (ErfK/YbiS/YcfS/YnhG family)
MRVRRSSQVVVRRAPGNGCEGRIAFGGQVRRAALGRGGIRTLKREGDGGTPRGSFPVRDVLYRADRGMAPRTRLFSHAIRDGDGWCDDPADANYNRPVKLPARRSAEGLKRADPLYDVVIVVGYNDCPRVRGKGSAIFIHLARPGFTPTEGCVALSRRDLGLLLAHLRPHSRIVIGA